MPRKMIKNHVKHHGKSLKKFGNVTLKNVGAGFPDPCITLRKDSPKELVGMFFNPTGVYEVGVKTLVTGGKVKKKFAKKKPLKKYCLY